MSEPLSNTHNQPQNSSLQNSNTCEEEGQPQMCETKIEETESQEHVSDDCEEFPESNDQSESGMELSPQMVEMLISPYVRRHNELKATLIQALHTHHAATNVVRVARKYIYCLYGIIENLTVPNSHNALINLRDEAYEREEELKHWETMFNTGDIAQSLMDAINEPSPGDSKSNSLSTPNANTIPQTLSRVTEHVGRNLSKQQTNGISNDSREDAFNMHPVEMLELSMQTSSQDQHEHSDDDYDDEIHSSRGQNSDPQNYGAQVLQGFLNESDFANLQKQQKSNNDLNGDKRQFFTCEYDDCNYSTHNRQRLNMHQKGHTGTPLFYCDIEGCGYLSNFKGNIKIHKRHKHKEGFDNDCSPNKSRGRKRKFENMLFNDSSVNANHSNDQINEATLESSSNDSKKDKDDLNICQFDAQSGNYVCQWPRCGWITRWKQLIEPHILGHTGMKPYKCDVPGCDYQTNYKGNVKLHKKKHIKEGIYNSTGLGIDEDLGSYKCDIKGCEFQTVWKNSYESHIRNHLKGNTSTLTNSTLRSNDSPRLVVFTRPGDKTPTRLSIIRKPLSDKETNGIEKKHSLSEGTASFNDDDEASLKEQLQDGPSAEYSKMSSSHSNSPEAEAEDEDEEDDEPEFINQYIDKSTSRPFLVNNSHY